MSTVDYDVAQRDNAPAPVVEEHVAGKAATRLRRQDNTLVRFFEESERRSRALYPRDKTGFLLLGLDPESKARSATAFISEHRPLYARKYQIELTTESPATLEVPAGAYTIVVRAPNFEPHRACLEVTPDRTIAVQATIDEPGVPMPQFDERVRALNIPITDRLGDLIVEEGTTVVLDGSQEAQGAQLHNIKIRTVDAMKSLLGISDDRWPGEYPRFGRMVESEAGSAIRQSFDGNLTMDLRFAMREYVYGNSRSVQGWRDTLNRYIAADAGMIVPIYLALTIDVGPHAVLLLNGACLNCMRLRVHYTGKVRIVGNTPSTIDTDVFERYGALISPSAALQDVVHVSV
jgi:hypothetical protein